MWIGNGFVIAVAGLPKERLYLSLTRDPYKTGFLTYRRRINMVHRLLLSRISQQPPRSMASSLKVPLVRSLLHLNGGGVGAAVAPSRSVMAPCACAIPPLSPFTSTPTTRTLATDATSDAASSNSTNRMAAANNTTLSTVSKAGNYNNKSAFSKRVGGVMAAAAGLLATATGGSLLTSWCDENEAPPTTAEKSTEPTTTTTTPHVTPPNPFWPSGVDSKQVDALVEDCLKDPTINIVAIPDYMERQLYKSTIQLTLNLIYHVLGQLHGTSILAHELQLHRLPLDKETEQQLSQLRNDLDEAVLEEMADRMLANKAVNQPLIPDALERQLYVNCLKIVFRLLDLLSATLAVSVCGHDFRLSIEPTQRKQLLTEQAQKVLDGSSAVATTTPSESRQHAICTPVDTDLLLAYASHEAGIDIHEGQTKRSWFSRLFQPNFSQQFTAQLHASLYGLILGILDDLLTQTTLVLLNDGVQMDLVPVPEHVRLERLNQESADLEQAKPQQPSSDQGYLPLASFTMGVGVGLCLMTIVKDYKRFL